MNTGASRALAVITVLVAGVALACTDTVVEPKSTVTEANIFSDPNSYKAFIAKVYGGLALTGQQGPTNQPDILGLDEGFAEYVRVWWQLNQLPTDETIVAPNDSSSCTTPCGTRSRYGTASLGDTSMARRFPATSSCNRACSSDHAE